MFRRERAERPGRRRTHCVTWRKGGIMIDQRMLDALLNFEPLPEDVKKRMVCLDRGAYWLWSAAIAVVGEFGLCVFGMVAIIYNLQ